MSGEAPVGTGLSGWFNRTGWRDILIGTPYVWLILFFLVPFIIVVAMSLAMRAGQSPPFAFLDGWPYVRFDNFARLFEDNLFVRSFLISLYNAAGYFEPNDRNANSLNSITAVPNDDGSITVSFGDCDDNRPNCLPIMDGWNYLVRLYRPRPEVLDGSWTFPAIQAA